MGICHDKPGCRVTPDLEVIEHESVDGGGPGDKVEENLVLDELFPAKMEFGILLRRDGDAPLGLDLDVMDGRTAWVLAIKDGIAATFNAGVPDGSQLKVYDFIVEVNGARNDSKAMVASLKADRNLALQVRRPQTFDVKLCKDKRPLGFDFTVEPQGRAVVIDRINEGCLRDWNFENPRKQVKPKDRIFAVDGEVDSGQGLFEKIRSADADLELSVVRPEEDEAGFLVRDKL